MYKEELGDFFRALAKSTISENFRESINSNYTPRISTRIYSDQELPNKDPSELTPSYNRPADSPNRPSSFIKKKGVLPQDPRKTLIKRGGSVSASDLLDSKENPLEMIENTERKTKGDSLELMKNFLLIVLENERMATEMQSWRLLFTELEKRYLQEVKDLRSEVLKAKSESEIEKNREIEDFRVNYEARRKSMIDKEIRETVMKFNEERGAWEADLKRIRENYEKKSRELEISKQNNEKLQRAMMNFKTQDGKISEFETNIALYLNEIEKLNEILRKKTIEIKELEAVNNRNIRIKEEIEQWKARNSKLELKIQEIQGLEGVLLENESRMGALMRENEALKAKIKENSPKTEKFKDYENKVALLSVELERLTLISNKKLEENDSLKQKVNKLEILVTEYRLKEGKLYKEIAELKKI